MPELFSLSYKSKIQLFPGAHSHFSFRCDGWIRAKDWSSVSRVCSRRQRIHRKAGVLRSGKVSPLLARLSTLTSTRRRKILPERALGCFLHVFHHFAAVLMCFMCKRISSSDVRFRNTMYWSLELNPKVKTRKKLNSFVFFAGLCLPGNETP